MKRAGNHFGSLETRGAGKPYLMRISYNGQRFSKSSGETDREKAEKALKEWAKHFQEVSEIENIKKGLINQLKNALNILEADPLAK